MTHPFARKLLAHYDRSKRDLPWRRPPFAEDPYALWVAEVMLQQTRVQTIAPRYERFLARFPTVEALAAARPDEVLLEWSGLGYYARGRNLHSAAREVVARYGGALPQEPAALAKLPGIGRYTAGAVASIAFGRRAPVVDGNVARVLSRLFRVEGDPRAPAVEERLWVLAEHLVPAERPGDFNQALMELGATVCTPRSPRCGACPLRHRCEARKAGRQGDLPLRAPKRPVPKARGVAVVIVRRGKLLLVRRPDRGLLAGLWEPPSGGRRVGESIDASARRAVRESAGVPIGRLRRAGFVRHRFSHRDLRVDVCIAAITATVRPRPNLRWATPPTFDGFALSTLARRTIGLALGTRESRKGTRAARFAEVRPIEPTCQSGRPLPR